MIYMTTASRQEGQQFPPTPVLLKMIIVQQREITYQSLSELLLFNANSAIFQLYHRENKLIFNEMMTRSALY